MCIVRINLEKLTWRENSESCNADFWQVCRIGLSWNFKVLQWINLNESFRHFYIHYEEEILKKIRSSRFGDTQESTESPYSEWSCTYTGGENTG